MLNNCNVNIDDKNNHDYDFCHDQAALVASVNQKVASTIVSASQCTAGP